MHVCMKLSLPTCVNEKYCKSLDEVYQPHIHFTAVRLWGQRAFLTMTHYNNAYTASNRPAQFTSAAHKFHLGCVKAGNVQSHSGVGTGVILLSIRHQESMFHIIMTCSLTNASWLKVLYGARYVALNRRENGFPINLSHNHKKTDQLLMSLVMCRLCVLWGGIILWGAATPVSRKHLSTLWIFDLWFFVVTFSIGLRHCSSKAVGHKTFPLSH